MFYILKSKVLDNGATNVIIVFTTAHYIMHIIMAQKVNAIIMHDLYLK